MACIALDRQLPKLTYQSQKPFDVRETDQQISLSVTGKQIIQTRKNEVHQQNAYNCFTHVNV